MSLIDQGNQIFKARDFQKAKEFYQKWLNEVYETSANKADLRADAVRCLSNLALSEFNLQNFQGAINSASKVIEFDKNHKKSYTIIQKSLLAMGKLDSFLECCKMEAMNQKFDNILELADKDPQHIINSLPHLLDLSFLLSLSDDVVQTFAGSRNKKYLGSIVKKQYHDSWVLHNYFDENTEDKYVQCPPEKFFIPSKSENPTEEEKKLSERYFWMFAYAFQRFHGLPNFLFSKEFLLKYYELAPTPEIMEKSPPIILWIDQTRRVSNLRLVFGYVRATSINYTAESGDRGAVSRDMDPWCWIEAELFPKDSNNPYSDQNSAEKEKDTYGIDLCGKSINNNAPFGIFNKAEMEERRRLKSKDFEMNIKEWVNKDQNLVKEYDSALALYKPDPNPLPFFAFQEIDKKFEEFVQENVTINKSEMDKTTIELMKALGHE